MSHRSSMKKKPEHEEDQDFEILKAVVQAWQGYSSNSSHTNEFDAHRRNYRTRPSRFKLEAMKKTPNDVGSSNWDFGQSLWDSYEIVTLSKKLEAGLVLDHPLSGTQDLVHVHKKRRESKNSLRNLFHQMSSKRFDVNIPVEEDGYSQF